MFQSLTRLFSSSNAVVGQPVNPLSSKPSSEEAMSLGTNKQNEQAVQEASAEAPLPKEMVQWKRNDSAAKRTQQKVLEESFKTHPKPRLTMSADNIPSSKPKKLAGRSKLNPLGAADSLPFLVPSDPIQIKKPEQISSEHEVPQEQETFRLLNSEKFLEECKEIIMELHPEVNPIRLDNAVKQFYAQTDFIFGNKESKEEWTRVMKEMATELRIPQDKREAYYHRMERITLKMDYVLVFNY